MLTKDKCQVAQRKELESACKSEWEKRTGEPWPKGWTLKDLGKALTLAWQRKEAEKAFSKLFYKALGVSQGEISKANHDSDWSFFWGIGAASNRSLKIEWVKNRLLKAIEQNDLKFFIRFGDTLKRKPRQIELDKVAFTLSFFWDSPIHDKKKTFYVPRLSCFTDDALLDYLKILTGNEKLTFDQIRKTRQRLGLETKSIKIKGVQIVQNGFIKFIWVDKV